MNPGDLAVVPRGERMLIDGALRTCCESTFVLLLRRGSLLWVVRVLGSDSTEAIVGDDVLQPIE